MKKLALLLIPLALSACQKELTASQKKLQAKLPPDAELSADGTLLAQGRVIHVADGDTLTVLSSDQQEFKIRLQGIDSPERKQPFGNVCKQQLLTLAINQKADVEAYKQDKYGRVVAKVSVNGKDVALEQLRTGCAWHYTAYAKEQNPHDRDAYAQAEQQARQSNIGLWQDASPIAPWDYRHKK
jgi:endonuclease YncB( thermonuclease family)